MLPLQTDGGGGAARGGLGLPRSLVLHAAVAPSFWIKIWGSVSHHRDANTFSLLLYFSCLLLKLKDPCSLEKKL